MLNNFINYVYFIWHTVYMENALHDFISTCDPLVINPTPSRLTGPNINRLQSKFDTHPTIIRDPLVINPTPSTLIVTSLNLTLIQLVFVIRLKSKKNDAN